MRAICWASLVPCILVFAGALRGDDQATAKALVDRALKAMGGEDKVARFKNGTWKATVTPQEAGQNCMLITEGAWHGLDKARLTGEISEGGKSHKIQIVINGKEGWLKKDDAVEDVPEPIRTFVMEISYAMRMVHLLPQLKDGFTLAPLGEVTVNDKPAVGMSVAHADHKMVNVYFNKETSLPMKSEVRLTDPDGKEITVELLYDDFQEGDGVKHPRKITLKADGKQLDVAISEIKPKDKVDESEFARP